MQTWCSHYAVITQTLHRHYTDIKPRLGWLGRHYSKITQFHFAALLKSLHKSLRDSIKQFHYANKLRKFTQARNFHLLCRNPPESSYAMDIVIGQLELAAIYLLVLVPGSNLLSRLLSFSWIGHCELFPSKEEEIQLLDLFEEKKICQLASKKHPTSFHIT